MVRGTLRILLLEDSAADAELVSEEIHRAGIHVILERVSSRDGFTSALREFNPDVVLSDHALAQFNAWSALKLLRAARPSVPLIIVTGALDEHAAVACLRAGAENFVLKSNLSRLMPAIEGALSVRRPLDALSPRQMEVLRLVVEGHTTREIAQRLRLSVKTVETHRGQVMSRLGLHDVVGLVRYAVRVGLVAPEG
jgi:DNA-binding NarL/FixJ family response regulator